MAIRFTVLNLLKTKGAMNKIYCHYRWGRPVVFFLLLLCSQFSFSQISRLWATYYGGTGNDQGSRVATDAVGNVYVVGNTASAAGIAYGGFQNTYGGGAYDAFLVKFDSSGNRLWATYYGGTGDDYGVSIAADALGNVFLAGFTSSAAGAPSG